MSYDQITHASLNLREHIWQAVVHNVKRNRFIPKIFSITQQNVEALEFFLINCQDILNDILESQRYLQLKSWYEEDKETNAGGFTLNSSNDRMLKK